MRSRTPAAAAPSRTSASPACGSPSPRRLCSSCSIQNQKSKIDISVLRKVVLVLVPAARLLSELHEQIVGQRRGADPEEIRSQPGVSECLLDEDEQVECLFGGLDSAGRLHPD